MTFHSILFERTEDRMTEETPEAPAFFVDLNLDQVIHAITLGKQEYNLKPFYYASLHDTDAIAYRHEVMRDLENGTLFESIDRFAHSMRAMREHLTQAGKLYYKYQKESWFLDAVEIYCDAVNCLADDLSRADLKSRGFSAFRAYVADYIASARFTSLLAETKKLKADLSTVRYCILIKGNAVKVRKYASEIDYSVDVESTFEKFKQGAVKDYTVKLPSFPDMNHVEAQVLDLVARLYPDIFLGLNDYCAKNGSYLDETISVFDREVQFYVAYLEHVAEFRRTGLKFCYPRVTGTCKEIYDNEGFDLALARKLGIEGSPIVCNDFHLQDKERIIVVSGPNQGGKTTFARTFGQLHYLASLGCPVPGREAQLYLFDRLFTHFEQAEDPQNLRGKLEDDLVRIHDILDQATPRSIIIMNEILTSTTLQDAISLGKKVMARIIELDLLCVCVTFLDELASLGEQTVSMVSKVVPENPTVRTFKIVRRPPDGLSYAISIAEKYRLTYHQLRERTSL
jgi:DNA mismatch repair protein MutS